MVYIHKLFWGLWLWEFKYKPGWFTNHTVQSLYRILVSYQGCESVANKENIALQVGLEPTLVIPG